MSQKQAALLTQLARVGGSIVVVLLGVLLGERGLRQILGLPEVLLLPQIREVLTADDRTKILLIGRRLLGHKNILVPALQIDQGSLGLVVLHLEARRLMLVLLLDVQVLEIEYGGIIVYDGRDWCLLRLQSLLLRHQTEFHLILLRHYHLLLLSQFLELWYSSLQLLILNQLEEVLGQIGDLQVLLRQLLLDIFGRRALTHGLQADHGLLLGRGSSLAAENAEDVALLRLHHLQALLLSGLHQLGNETESVVGEIQRLLRNIGASPWHRVLLQGNLLFGDELLQSVAQGCALVLWYRLLVSLSQGADRLRSHGRGQTARFAL